jgi:hypothetical protein
MFEKEIELKKTNQNETIIHKTIIEEISEKFIGDKFYATI